MHEVDCFCQRCCIYDVTHSAKCVGRCDHCIARYSCRACGREVDETGVHVCGMTPSDPVVNIYSPKSEHNDAYIRGTERGLRLLRAAINAALSWEGNQGHVLVFSGDGEQYALHVVKVEESDVGSLRSHYTGRVV